MERGKITSKRDWKRELLEYRKSGKRKREWCLECEVPLSTFNGWLAREKKAFKAAEEKGNLSDMENKVEKSPKWIKAEALKNSFSKQNTPITIKIGAFEVLVEKHFDKVVFLEILSAIKELC